MNFKASYVPLTLVHTKINEISSENAGALECFFKEDIVRIKLATSWVLALIVV